MVVEVSLLSLLTLGVWSTDQGCPRGQRMLGRIQECMADMTMAGDRDQFCRLGLSLIHRRSLSVCLSVCLCLSSYLLTHLRTCPPTTYLPNTQPPIHPPTYLIPNHPSTHLPKTYIPTYHPFAHLTKTYIPTNLSTL